MHAHSTASDGEKTPEELKTWAEENKILLAITDHNSVDAHRRVESPNILPGVEICFGASYVDILFYGERGALIEFFEKTVEPLRDPVRPCFTPVPLAVIPTMELALEAGLHIAIPHYAMPAGIVQLDADARARIGRMPVLVELNGHLSHARNERAVSYAQAFDLPIIAADDTHSGDYARTLTHVPLPEAMAPTVGNLVAAIREAPQALRREIREPTLRETLATLRQIRKAIGVKTLVRNGTRKVRAARARKKAMARAIEA